MSEELLQTVRQQIRMAMIKTTEMDLVLIENVLFCRYGRQALTDVIPRT